MVSSLGIRSTGHPPIVKLAALIWNSYEALGVTDELDWRVRSYSGNTPRHSVMDFIRAHGPEGAVRSLILPFRDVTTFVGEELFFKIYAGETEEGSTRRLLWKLGFNIARYEEEYAILRKRLTEFRDVVLRTPPRPTEDERALVRAVGVKLFVAVEQFLQDVISYNCWLLASDHFTGTRFCFTKQDALRAVPKALGEEIKSGAETLAWSTDGMNTLGVLLGYLHGLRSWLKGRSDAEKTDIRRKAEDYPHYRADTVWVFPFEHSELWADIPTEVLEAYTGAMDQICKQIAQSGLPVVRNGLDDTSCNMPRQASQLRGTPIVTIPKN